MTCWFTMYYFVDIQYSYYVILYIFTYTAVGIATGTGGTLLKILAAKNTESWKRFKSIASISMMRDVVSLILPLIIWVLYSLFGFNGLIWFWIVLIVLTSIIIIYFQKNDCFEWISTTVVNKQGFKDVLNNKPFQFILVLEFLDSFASSQLFVYLPVLLLFKNFSIQNALLMQSLVLFGYFCGRWLIGQLAHRSNGYLALLISDIGMILSILALLLLPSWVWIYGICYILWIFTRWTSPVLTSLSFDQLAPEEINRGSSLHIVVGDGASALAQFIFGLLVAYLWATAPYYVSMIFAWFIIILCLYKLRVQNI